MKKPLEVDLEIDYLKLPSRFEILEKEIEEKKLNIIQIVQEVDEDKLQIQLLARQLKINNIGRFQVFYGISGAGKTTFIKTLSIFFENVEVIPISRDIDLLEIPDFVINNQSDDPDKHSIFIFEDRDNPNESEEDLKVFFEELRVLFRKDKGKVIIIWPITDFQAAEHISLIAWNTARDSITQNKKPFIFNGLPKDKFYEVADITCKGINGISLEAYGITKKQTDKLLKDCETIGEFFSNLETLSSEISLKNENFLKHKLIPKVWILLPGDDPIEIDRTVKSLTQGLKNRIDIDRFISTLDDNANKSAYLNDWRAKRDIAAFLMRLLDVRIIPIFPTVSLSSIRAYGDPKIIASLKKQNEKKEVAIENIKKSILYKLLFDDISSNSSSPTKLADTHTEEYLRLQRLAEKDDKLLNRAIGDSLIDALDSDDVKAIVYIEQQELEGFNLKPDIQIRINDKTVICLEPTWRSTGKGIEGELDVKQNSLTLGHIQQYVLSKVMEYVKELKY
ncbi:hypothetical protein B0A56_13490 [Flavobacterium columnare NBRC 100251 = ATCC 23463]|nr:hypothetical protein B0A56_13490 [Flavobacterium columnare NBRC 100251 = ATCC 23463]